jgi:hypothetical protein
MGIARQINEMFGRTFARVIRKHARVCEGIEFGVGPYQFSDRSTRIGLRQPESDFADDLVTLISPSPRIAAERQESKYRNQKIAHTASFAD